MEAPSLEALVYDPEKCSKLSVDQKRELIYEMSKWPDGATEMLQAWSRPEILQVLCAVLGKERKYTGLTKSKMIEQLLKTVNEKKSVEHKPANPSELQPSSDDGERTPKRLRKSDHLNLLPVSENSAAAAAIASDVDSGNTTFCKNSACKAKMNGGDVFCKRCSCCICRKYDDNKDPSLWLVCNSDPPFHGMSCGMSCHLECALRHENSGISKDHQDKGLDGSFSCVSCGKVNDLLCSWRKQMVVARDTRRVDEMCYRLSLGQKILTGTKHYHNLYKIVDEAVQKLEEDMGPLTGIPVKRARGIVNRLSSGPEVQRRCASAVEALDLMLSNRVLDSPADCNTHAAKLVQFEDIRDSSLTVILNSNNSNLENVVGYNLWHRKVGDIDYPAQPTCRLFASNTKFLLSGLAPATQYFLKVAIFDQDREMGCCEFQFRTSDHQDEVRNLSIQSPVTNFSSLSNPSSAEDEINNGNEDVNRGDNYLPSSAPADKTSSANLLAHTVNSSDQSQKEGNGDVICLSEEDNSMATKPGVSSVRNKVESSSAQDLVIRPSILHLSDSSNGQIVEETSRANRSNTTPPTGLECVPSVDRTATGLPSIPCKMENMKEGNKRNIRPKDTGKETDDEPQAGSSSKKKRSSEGREEECKGIGDKGFEYYIKVIRSLECDGHIEAAFRQKLLTWFSLRATPQEVRVVKVFIDTFVEDPESLAGQLVDAFSDRISNKRCTTVPAGFCTKLWH